MWDDRQEGPSLPRAGGWLGRTRAGGYGWADSRGGAFSGIAFLYVHLWARPGEPAGRGKALLTPTGMLQKAPKDSWRQAAVILLPSQVVSLTQLGLYLNLQGSVFMPTSME